MVLTSPWPVLALLLSSVLGQPWMVLIVCSGFLNTSLSAAQNSVELGMNLYLGRIYSVISTFKYQKDQLLEPQSGGF